MIVLYPQMFSQHKQGTILADFLYPILGVSKFLNIGYESQHLYRGAI